MDQRALTSEAWASFRHVSNKAVNGFLDEKVGDANSDNLTDGAGTDLFIINMGETITDPLQPRRAS